jgi:hypothetical protein
MNTQRAIINRLGWTTLIEWNSVAATLTVINTSDLANVFGC